MKNRLKDLKNKLDKLVEETTITSTEGEPVYVDVKPSTGPIIFHGPQFLPKIEGEIKVYLDDERDTPAGWIRTYNVEQTIALLSTRCVQEISLDHDLALLHYAGDYSKERTGYHFSIFGLPIHS